MENSTSQKSNRLVVILLAVIVVLLVAVLGMFMMKGKEEPTAKLTYATEGTTVVDDQNALQKAVDEAYAKVGEGSIALNYKREAVSTDGQNFACYIGNSKANAYDMYIGIYADTDYTDQLFLSGLIRPGEAFESLTLDRALPKGEHEVYVAYTQVEEDLNTIHAQVFVKMLFIVK